jgi:hypothetical protein
MEIELSRNFRLKETLISTVVVPTFHIMKAFIKVHGITELGLPFRLPQRHFFVVEILN